MEYLLMAEAEVNIRIDELDHMIESFLDTSYIDSFEESTQFTESSVIDKIAEFFKSIINAIGDFVKSIFSKEDINDDKYDVDLSKLNDEQRAKLKTKKVKIFDNDSFLKSYQLYASSVIKVLKAFEKKVKSNQNIDTADMSKSITKALETMVKNLEDKSKFIVTVSLDAAFKNSKVKKASPETITEIEKIHAETVGVLQGIADAISKECPNSQKFVSVITSQTKAFSKVTTKSIKYISSAASLKKKAMKAAGVALGITAVAAGALIPPLAVRAHKREKKRLGATDINDNYVDAKVQLKFAKHNKDLKKEDKKKWKNNKDVLKREYKQSRRELDEQLFPKKNKNNKTDEETDM